MKLKQLVYVSSYVDEYGLDLPNFMESISLTYKSDDVRMMTLFSKGEIMQLLEGPDIAVQHAFEKLQRDVKQITVTVLIDKQIETRQLTKTCMGYNTSSWLLISNPPATVGLFRLNHSSVYKQIMEGPANVLMVQFARDCH